MVPQGPTFTGGKFTGGVVFQLLSMGIFTGTALRKGWSDHFMKFHASDKEDKLVCLSFEWTINLHDALIQLHMATASQTS